jgi:hypothetical protein
LKERDEISPRAGRSPQQSSSAFLASVTTGRIK